MHYWLLAQSALQEMQASARAFRSLPEAERSRILAAAHPPVGAENPNLKIAGNIAEISIEGVLTERSYYSWFYSGGGSTYRGIRDAIASADQDPTIKKIVLNINSPGGNVDGLFETLDAIKRCTKPMEVVASRADSAAYAIAAAAGKIAARHESSEFGSVGVAVTYVFWDDMEEIDLTNTDSPDKRPDPRTPEGKAVIVRELDAINEMFVTAIAEGRTAFGRAVSSDDVKQNFGRGAVMFASDAKRAGLIDTVPKKQTYGRPTKGAEGNETPADASAVAANDGGKEKTMDLKTLKASHPELYAAVFTEGKEAGVKEERDRCDAHLTLGEGSGDMKLALAGIRDGSAVTQAIQAKHMAAHMNRATQATRDQDATAAAAAVSGATAPAEQAPATTTSPGAPAAKGDVGDQIVALIDAEKAKA